MTTEKILITSAIDSESNTLREHYKSDHEIIAIGVGLVNASATISNLLSQNHYKRVLFTGTCGVIDTTAFPIGSVVHANRVILSDLSILKGDSFIPNIMTHDIQLTTHAKNALTVITCPGITKTESARHLVQNTLGNCAENMEAFAVAAICQRFKIPCDIILGVSNRIGATAHEEWLSNHVQTSHQTQSYLIRFLEE
ncbi:MAG: hypothetical protein COV45_01010 [Deltaproteobacteria bacterium CG11_big_fil_rev_8_21_14_0_20_47_16]|nr:MAG: hypothetical protein COV45_01010 [Deltaproteobacteria bacterium CG11_big_fil_rev_8_21_14_0_20_47_16]